MDTLGFRRKEIIDMYRISFIMLLVIGLLIPTVSQAGAWTGNINAFMGIKTLDSDDWDDNYWQLSEQTEGGILFDIMQANWPVCAVIESMYGISTDEYDDFELNATTTEVFLGAGKTWAPNSTIRPFVRAGLNYATAELEGEYENQTETVDGSGIGYAISGGVYWTLSQHFNLGLSARYSKATVEINDIDVEAGGTHSGLILGYHW